jgi:hypothetical protein
MGIEKKPKKQRFALKEQQKALERQEFFPIAAPKE